VRVMSIKRLGMTFLMGVLMMGLGGCGSPAMDTSSSAKTSQVDASVQEKLRFDFVITDIDSDLSSLSALSASAVDQQLGIGFSITNTSDADIDIVFPNDPVSFHFVIRSEGNEVVYDHTVSQVLSLATLTLGPNETFTWSGFNYAKSSLEAHTIVNTISFYLRQSGEMSELITMDVSTEI